MKASIDTVTAAIEAVKQKLSDCNLLMDWNASVIVRADRYANRVTWATSGTRPDLSDVSTSNIEEYLAFLRGRHFQFQLIDGSLIQISYDINRRDVVEQSRLVWYPCPVSFQAEELEYAPIEELVLTSPVDKLTLKAPLRFDFAPHQEADNHSCTHLHIGTENFRLPVQRAMEPLRFLRFIVRTAYPQVWDSFPNLKVVEDWSCEDKLNEDDKVCGAISWHLPIGAGVRQ